MNSPHAEPLKPTLAWLLFVIALSAAVYWGLKHDRVLAVTLVFMGAYAASMIVKSLLLLAAIGKESRRCDHDFTRLLEPGAVAAMASKKAPSLLAKHILACRACPGDGARESLLAGFATDLHNANAGVRQATVALPALGLLGTVLGLTIMGQQFSAALQSDDPLPVMKKAMGGLGVAYATTLLGCMTGTLVLGILASITDAAIDRLAAQIGARGAVILAGTEQKEQST